VNRLALLQPVSRSVLLAAVSREQSASNIRIPAPHGGDDSERRQPVLTEDRPNDATAGGTLTVTDGRHAAAIALLGNYMAGSFVTTADGQGGTLFTQAAQTGQQPLLTHPRA
jgi:hypothetical protein